MDYLHHSKRLPTVTTNEDSINVLVHLGSKVLFLMRSLYNVLPSPHNSWLWRSLKESQEAPENWVSFKVNYRKFWIGSWKVVFPKRGNIYIAQHEGFQNDSDEETGVGWGLVEEPRSSCLVFTCCLT